MASTTSDSLPSSPSLPGTGTDQEFSSVDHHSLFLPSSSCPVSLYLDSSSFHGFLPTSSPTHMFPSPAPAPSQPLGPSKPLKKRPRASRRPPTTVLTTDTSNFRTMVQEFTGFPAPPFATGPPPSVRPRLLGDASGLGPPFLLRPSPLKYPHNPVLLPVTCTTATATTTTLANTATTGGGTSSLMDTLALFARSNVMMSSSAAAATATAGGSGADQYGGHHGMGGFNPFDDFEAAAAAAAEVEKANGGHGFFSSLGGGAGDKYDRH